jgi:hypothetical protein
MILLIRSWGYANPELVLLLAYFRSFRTGNRLFLGSKRPPPTANTVEKAGGLAPHLFQWVLWWEGPFRSPKLTISGPEALLRIQGFGVGGCGGPEIVDFGPLRRER